MLLSRQTAGSSCVSRLSDRHSEKNGRSKHRGEKQLAAFLLAEGSGAALQWTVVASNRSAGSYERNWLLELTANIFTPISVTPLSTRSLSGGQREHVTALKCCIIMTQSQTDMRTGTDVVGQGWNKEREKETGWASIHALGWLFCKAQATG